MNTTLNGRLDQYLGAQSAALTLREQRQQVLASNIANADTPGYKAVDFDFTNALRAATGALPAPEASNGVAPPAASVSPSSLALTEPGHLSASRSAFAGISTQYRMPAQPAADGNSVDMNLEGARFAENSVKYEAALKFLNGQIKTLMSAIQG